MPRTGRGGSRSGTVGTAYTNRTDLNAREPIETAPNQTYGEAAQQRAAQGAVPMAPTPVTPTSVAPAPVAPAQSAPRPASPPVQPGSLPWMGPTNRPDEPVTEGMPFGPGANSMNVPPPKVSDQLVAMAKNGGSDMFSNIAASAQAMGL